MRLLFDNRALTFHLPCVVQVFIRCVMAIWQACTEEKMSVAVFRCGWMEGDRITSRRRALMSFYDTS